ncbi:hypothetical protein [Kitasatospora sp. NPDC087314]|uniref:hypothetical protein n=1 Tax=Kitasatospora sp. NPDC087314 TaxID=3364068 RepID=UPI003809BD4C
MFHSFARLSGFGVSITPKPPYTVERTGSSETALSVTRHTPDSVRRGVDLQGFPDNVEARLVGVGSLNDVIEVGKGGSQEIWLIETTNYSSPWPEGFAIDSPPPGDNSAPFYLFGENSSVIYVQGPAPTHRAESLPGMVAPGQRVIREASTEDLDLVEFSYDFEGTEWRQMLIRVMLSADACVVVTTQAAAAEAGTVAAAAEAMARGVRATVLP